MTVCGTGNNMPLLRAAKNISPDDWVIVVSQFSGLKIMSESLNSREIEIYNTGKLAVSLMRADVCSGNGKGSSYYSKLVVQPFRCGFSEHLFRYSKISSIFYGQNPPFAILNGKPPVGAYAHRKLLRRIVSKYAKTFFDTAVDAWYKDYCRLEDI